MKTLFAIAALTAFNLAAAQKTTQLKEFKGITVGADIKVTLVKSDENKIVVEGDDELQVQNEGGYLVLNGDANKVTVYYNDAIESIAAASDSEVYGKDEIKSASLNIAAASDAKVQLNLNVGQLNTAAASDADVILTGKAKSHKASLASDADLRAKDLVTDNLDIVVSSDASAVVTANGVVNATVSSDGSLTIHGNPKKVNQTKSGDAEIVVVK